MQTAHMHLINRQTWEIIQELTDKYLTDAEYEDLIRGCFRAALDLWGNRDKESVWPALNHLYSGYVDDFTKQYTMRNNSAFKNRAKFCRQYQIKNYERSFDHQSINSNQGTCDFEIKALTVRSSPEALLCQLLNEDCRILAVSATINLEHNETFNWPSIEEELPGSILQYNNDPLHMDKIVAEMKNDREKYLNIRDNFQTKAASFERV